MVMRNGKYEKTCNFQVKNVQHKQETRFQSSSMEEGAMKYYSASDRRTGEGVQG